jgi:LemA protein
MERINFWSIIFILFGVSLFIFFITGSNCSGCFSNEALFLKLFVIGLMFIGATFLMSHKWAKINTLLYKIERQPLLSIAACTDEVPAQVCGEIIPKEGVLKSPVTNTECVYYHYIKERYEKHNKHSSWVVVQNNSNHVPFKVKDESGEITVNLANVDSDLGSFLVNKPKYDEEDHFFVDYENSEVDCIKSIYKKSCGVNERESEYILVPNMKVFVNGWVHKIKNQKIIAEHEYMPLIVSRKTKEAYLEDFAKGDNFFFTSNFILMIGGVVLVFSLSFIGLFSWTWIALVPVIMLIRITYNSYNRMLELSKRCDNALSQIDIELKKRVELIPILEKTTKRYTKYEKALIQLTTVIRSDAVKSNHEFEKKFFAIVEAYPDLKTNTLFKEFTLNLKTIEDNIAYYRGFHNKTVTKYNTLIGLFPFIILSKIFNFKEKQLLEFK